MLLGGVDPHTHLAQLQRVSKNTEALGYKQGRDVSRGRELTCAGRELLGRDAITLAMVADLCFGCTGIWEFIIAIVVLAVVLF